MINPFHKDILKTNHEIHKYNRRLHGILQKQHIFKHTLPDEVLKSRHEPLVRGGGFGKWLKHNAGLATGIGLGVGAVALAPFTGGTSLAEGAVAEEAIFGSEGMALADIPLP